MREHQLLLTTVLTYKITKDIQIKLLEEVENVVGDRSPTHEDKQNCHYVNAFIAFLVNCQNSSER